MLRVRRHIFSKIPRRFRGYGADENRFHSSHRRRYAGIGRPELPDADGGRYQPGGSADSHHAPGGSSGEPLMSTTLDHDNFSGTIATTLADPHLQKAVYTATGRLMSHR